MLILCLIKHICFNPRTREGANEMGVPTIGYAISFNPRTREGANVSKLTKKAIEQLFQSTHP